MGAARGGHSFGRTIKVGFGVHVGEHLQDGDNGRETKTPLSNGGDGVLETPGLSGIVGTEKASKVKTAKEKIMAPSIRVQPRTYISPVLIAQKQPERARANQQPGFPVVKPAQPIRRRQAWLLASPGQRRGPSIVRGAPRAWTPAWAQGPPPGCGSGHAFGCPADALRDSASWSPPYGPKRT